MANLNVYKIDHNEVEACLNDLSQSKFEQKKTISQNIIIDETPNIFEATLYIEKPSPAQKGVSWNWVLDEFSEPALTTIKSPKAIVLIKNKTHNNFGTYAITFGSSYYKIDKYCDRDFGFKFAARIEYSNIKTTTLTSPNLTRNKTVNTYIDYCNLEFDSGESFSKLKVNAKIPDNFTLFKAPIEIGNSIHFITENESIEGALNIIIYIKKILTIPDEEALYKIPVFEPVRDENLKSLLEQKIQEILINSLLNGEKTSSFSIPELEIIGANETFSHVDSEYILKYPGKKEKKITSLSIEIISEFCKEYSISTFDKIKKIKLITLNNGEQVATHRIETMVEYTYDEYKCIFSKGKWYKYNQDYLTYLDESICEIANLYQKQYDFNTEIHDSFINEMYEKEKEDVKFSDKTPTEIKKALKNKYYAERCFNLLRAQEEGYENFDREGTSAGYEKMDLYETKSSTMFAVKIGNASSDLCFAIDQSLISLKMLKSGKAEGMPQIKRVGLWFVLKKINPLPTHKDHSVDITALNMLMLKNRIDQWKKEVRLAGYEPIIYINYRN